MKSYVLIGGIGSGKSTVSRMLQQRGFACIDLDEIGHGLLGQVFVQLRLAQIFGVDIVKDGKVDRALLASRAFASQDALQQLNAIMHPCIAETALKLLDDLEHSGCPLAFVEISAFTGPGGPLNSILDECEGIVAITAPQSVRLARAVQKGFSEEDVSARMARQPSDALRLDWADYSISNAGSLASLERQIDELLPILLEGHYGAAVEKGF